MSKKGVTLIETVVYLALLSVVSLIFMGSISYYKQKQREIAYEREIESVKQFIILECIDSSNKNLVKQIGITKNQLYNKSSGERVKVSSLEIALDELIDKQFMINNGEITKSFKLKLKGREEEVYIIESCTTCKKMHI
ncbi:Tfp pilus assembly protein FimT/FimU [uncultured Clostridium sp.]|jgi:Tfp pilus assembly protein PilE|uniref:pilus assembly FimT family protein n=1 Tax=uncultured Clostridium sp. TaxID=59620 RepID=UPI00263970CB|nr:prepilin-type N-terminal cleavage/methylation domain-containing protein [uncultured Clostridium sp.]